MAKNKKGFSRRKFVTRSLVGAGVILGTGFLSCNSMRRYMAGVANTTEAPYIGNTKDPLLWLEVKADNTVNLYSTKVEMGQGVLTGLAQIAADELAIDINQLKVLHASSARNVDGFGTGGSTSIFSLWQPLRELAATMREMLRITASTLLNIPVAQLTAGNGVITGGGKSITYGKIAAQATDWSVPKTPDLKSVSDYKYVGKPVPRVDLKDKVMGAPIFGMDATMPDMLYGAVARPDQVGASFVSADITTAAAMPGVVKIVEESDFVGVVATSRMAAENAKNALKVNWATDKVWQSADIEDMIAVGKGKPFEIQKAGRAASILSEGENIITSEYKSPIGAHAQLEPNGAVAYVEADKATIYMSTQVVDITRKEIAKRLGFKTEQVVIQPTFLGGGFGRRLHTPNGIQAALMSKAVGKPVKCFLNRKEEFQNDTFRPPTHHVLKAKLSTDGNIEAIEHNVSSGDVMYGSPLVPGIAEPVLGHDIGAWRGGMFQYRGIPNYRAVSWRVKLPFATSWWRSLGLLANTFAIESFIDELAIQAGKDPVQFRIDHTQDDEAGRRLKAVLKAAADKAGWKDGVHNGRAMGFAASTDVNTPCAQVAEVSISADKTIKVHKVTCAMDPGLVINPDQVRAQCEGAIIMGMSGAMYEKMEVKDNKLTPTIYGPYQMALMRDAPKEIDVVLLQGRDTPGGVGEPPLGPIGAAIANAVFRLTGERLRAMPFELS